MLDEANDILDKTAHRMKKYVDQGCRPQDFQVGEQVLLKLTPTIWKRINRKIVHHELVPKYDGPFKVMKKVENVAYRLKLPDQLKIHPTFHVNFLKSFHEDLFNAGRRLAKKAAPKIRKQFDKEVDKIPSHRTMGQSKKNPMTDFLVHWKGGSEENAS